MKNIFFLIFLSTLFTLSCNSDENGSLQITVKYNNNLIEGADISSVPSGISGVTNNNGIYSIQDLQVGIYNVYASHPTFGSGDKLVEIKKDDQEEVTINLLGTGNNEPNLIINSPSSGSGYMLGNEITFTALVIDDRDAAQDMSIEWTSNIDGLLNSEPSNEQGLIQFSISTLSIGTHIITAKATDSGLLNDTEQIAINIIQSSNNQKPIVSIKSPDNLTSYNVGTLIDFSAVVSDDITDSQDLGLEWSSSIDGNLNSQNADATGFTLFSINSLSPGTHEIKLMATDADGLTEEDNISINIVEAGNTSPQAEIIIPNNNSNFNLGDVITFSGQVSDNEDPAQTLDIEWSSNIDGIINTQNTNSSGLSSFSYSQLSSGTHQITLKVTDSGEISSLDTKLINIENVNTPTVNITTPSSGSIHDFESNILFRGIVNDNVDDLQDLTIEWSSNINGIINQDPSNATGVCNFSTDALSIGNHIIRLKVTNSQNQSASANINITVISTEDFPPTISITSPSNNSLFSLNQNISFSGFTNDSEDIEQNLEIEWNSNLDGVINTSSAGFNGLLQFSTDNLSAGIHTITAKVTDSKNQSATDEINIQIYNFDLVLDLIGNENTGSLLNWNQYIDSDFGFYRVLRSTNNSSNFETLDVISNSNENSFLDMNAEIGQRYYYKIILVLDNGFEIESNIEDLIYEIENIDIGFSIERMKIDNTRPYIYALDRINNSLLFINTNTKELEKIIFIGSAPADLSFNLDNNLLYVANYGSTLISIVDLNTQTKIDEIAVDPDVGTWDGNPYRIACLSGDKLVHTSEDQWNDINLVDATNGAAIWSGSSIYQPGLITNSSQTILYASESGSSGSSLVRYNYDGSQLTIVDESVGSSNPSTRDASITADNSVIFYGIRKFLANNLSTILGTFGEAIIACTPDGNYAMGKTNIWNANDFSIVRPLPLQVESIVTPNDNNTLYLFDNETSKIYILEIE